MSNRTWQKWLLSLFCIGLAVSLGFSNGRAADPNPAAPVEKVEKYESGEPFAPEGSYFFGYRFLSQEDSTKAAEYVYPHSSVTFGMDLLSAPLPFRYHLNGEYLSQYDFYGDGGFAYKDMILFRDILVGVHHNLDHYNFQFPGVSPGLLYNDLNPGDNYYIDYTSNLLFLRLKTPEYPLHAFFKHRHVAREGKAEQRFLLNTIGSPILTSESRNINSRSNDYILGVNSHLGPIEIEYAYDLGKFDPRGDNELYNYYPPSSDLSRPGDVFPHNVMPDTESSAHSVKVHSSYTGGLVATATLTNLNQKNNYSLTESTTWKGAVDVSWIPDPIIGLFFKYRHRDVDLDTPDFVTLTGLNNTLHYEVRQGISYDKDVFSLSAKYRPLNWLSLIPTYEFTHTERQDVDQWDLLDAHSSFHTLNLTARAKPWDNVKLKAIYEYKHYDDPAYNTDPDNSNQLHLTATYFPVYWLNLYLDYLLNVTDRDELRYYNSSPSVLIEGGERNGRRDQLLASLSAMVSPKTTVTASWSYNRWDVEQDLVYGKRALTGGGDLPYIDAGAPYTDEANSFSLGLHYIPREDITVSADVTYTLSKGEYVPGNVLGESSPTLVSYTDLEAAETIFSFGISKKLPKDWELGFKFYADIYEDRTDDFLDGDLFITTFSLKRYF